MKERGITTIRGCNVPELIAFDDALWTLVMTVVKRPFVLDFGGAYLDKAPEFSEEVMAEWIAEKQEQFGHRWPEVRAFLNTLRSWGIIVIDVNPGNIALDE